MINRNIFITVIFLIMILLQSCDSKVDDLQKEIYRLRKLQYNLKYIVDNNPISGIYCSYSDLDNKVYFKLYDTITNEKILFNYDSYVAGYKNQYKIMSIDEINTICDLLYNEFGIEYFRYINYSKEYGPGSASKIYPSIDIPLTPDEMFSVSYFIELKSNVFKFTSAYKFVNTHKKYLGNIGVSEVGDSLFLYFQRHQNYN